jgi:hypothetical protein
MGSVVGNDPYSQEGQLRYGIPLQAIIFDGNTDSPNPRMVPVKLVPQGAGGDTPTPLEDHAATLFRLTPPISTGAAPDTFWSVNKKGQFKAAISGPARENSVEAALRGGLKLSVGGEFNLIMDGAVSLGSRKGNSQDNIGAQLSSEQGAVRIYGGGKVRGAEAVSQRNSPSGAGEADAPSVDIEARQHARFKAERNMLLKAANVETNASKVQVLGHQAVAIKSGTFIEVAAAEYLKSTSGKTTETYGGPKDALPTNGALHEVTYSPTLPGLTALEANFESGDRNETFKLGSHTTSALVGSLTYETQGGSFTAKAGANSVKLSSSGAAVTASTGDSSLVSKAGQANVSGRAWVNIVSEGGLVQVESGIGVLLQAPVNGPDQGPIICSGSIEPFTGLPFATWGMGAKSHIVANN